MAFSPVPLWDIAGSQWQCEIRGALN